MMKAIYEAGASEKKNLVHVRKGREQTLGSVAAPRVLGARGRSREERVSDSKKDVRC